MERGEDARLYPYEPDASGYIIYSDAGRVSATLMEQGRPALAAPVGDVARLKHRLSAGQGDAVDPSEIPMLTRYFRAAAGYMAYCGTFEVREGSVIHHIENSLFPEWIGNDLARTFSFSEDTLSLVGDAGGLVQHLLWQRVT